jgi:hypothetical protein
MPITPGVSNSLGWAQYQPANCKKRLSLPSVLAAGVIQQRQAIARPVTDLVFASFRLWPQI